MRHTILTLDVLTPKGTKTRFSTRIPYGPNLEAYGQHTIPAGTLIRMSPKGVSFEVPLNPETVPEDVLGTLTHPVTIPILLPKKSTVWDFLEYPTLGD